MTTTTIIAILGWPIVGLVLFASQKDPQRGAILSILVGFMFLPSAVGIDLSGLPAIDRDSIVALTLLAALMFASKIDKPLVVGGWIYTLAMVVYLTSPLFTALTNPDPVIAGARVIPGMHIYDGFSMIASEVLRIIPLFIGYWLITTVSDQRQMLMLIVAAGLFYSLFLLVETRLSPQFHNWVYGFHASDFIGTVRAGGAWRPTAFMPNGIVAAFFTMTVVISALAIWQDDIARKAKGQDRLSIVKPRWYGVLAIYMTGILVISRSLAALLFGILATASLVLTSTRSQVLAAAIITSVAFVYPVLRTLDLVPYQQLVSAASTFSERRAHSLNARFENEEQLLQKGLEKPAFGWGNWGRFRIYDYYGVDRTLSDGYWVIALSTRGIVGYLTTYIVLIAPVFMLWLQTLRYRELEISPITSGICLILSVNLLDLVPNATLTPLTWLFVGVLMRHVKETAMARADVTSPVTTAHRQRTVM